MTPPACVTLFADLGGIDRGGPVIVAAHRRHACGAAAGARQRGGLPCGGAGPDAFRGAVALSKGGPVWRRGDHLMVRDSRFRKPRSIDGGPLTAVVTTGVSVNLFTSPLLWWMALCLLI